MGYRSLNYSPIQFFYYYINLDTLRRIELSVLFVHGTFVLHLLQAVRNGHWKGIAVCTVYLTCMLTCYSVMSYAANVGKTVWILWCMLWCHC